MERNGRDERRLGVEMRGRDETNPTASPQALATVGPQSMRHGGGAYASAGALPRVFGETLGKLTSGYYFWVLRGYFGASGRVPVPQRLSRNPTEPCGDRFTTTTKCQLPVLLMQSLLPDLQ